MKKSRSLPRILCTLAFVCALVAFFCNFAPAFNEGSYGTTYGNLFNVIYGMEQGSYRNIVVPLVIAMSLLSLLVIVSAVGFALGEKAHKIIGGCIFLLGVATGVLYLLAVKFFVATNNPPSALIDGLGAGSICVAVFAFVSAFIGFLIVMFGKKKVAVG